MNQYKVWRSSEGWQNIGYDTSNRFKPALSALNLTRTEVFGEHCTCGPVHFCDKRGGRVPISDPLSSRRYSSEFLNITVAVVALFERSFFFYAYPMTLRCHSRSFIYNIQFCEPLQKNANRELVPYLRPGAVANRSVGLHNFIENKAW